MKKVLSVAMASAMVLGMGANAFAISYSTGSNEKADWPENFQFEGSLFVTDKDGNIVKEATTALNDNETVNFEPGDVIWMPLYADNQVEWTADITEGTDDKIGVSDIRIDDTDADYWKNATGEKVTSKYTDSEWDNDKANELYEKSDCVIIDKTGKKVNATDVKKGESYTVASKGNEASFTAPTTVVVDGETRNVSSVKVTVNGRTFTGAPATVDSKVNAYLKTLTDKQTGAYLPVTFSGTVSVKAEDGKDTTVDKPVVDNTTNGVTVAHGHYTGNIDKNWSINLIEKSTGVAELIEKAELYKATKNDYASYIGTTTEIMPNAVYLKITLEDEWKTTSSETLKYYVYIADNKAKDHKTNEVWVSGKYENTDYEWVNFDWTNDASRSKLWKVHDDESGVAVFDFADKAFFSVKMYGGETMYLDLETAYDKAIAGEMDAEADSFYKFDNTNANFARTGELIIVSDDSSLVPYQIDEDGNFVAVDAEYVENYAVAHTNKKVNGFVFNTKQLGNYVLSTEELGEEEPAEEPTTEEPVVEEPAVEEPVVEETNKPNPNTGAEDFVGLAVSLAVVSVAAAGALALKK